MGGFLKGIGYILFGVVLAVITTVALIFLGAHTLGKNGVDAIKEGRSIVKGFHESVEELLSEDENE